MKKWVGLVIGLVLLVGMAGIGGCAWRPNIAPTEPVTVEVSFSHGAPPLDQTAELICVVKAHIFDVRNMSIEISLPEALELVSGDLSWTGNISEGDEVEAIKAVVELVKTGNWTIEVHKYINPEEHGGFGGSGWHPIYVAISEDSAEWGEYPPWYEGGGHEVPIQQVEEGDVEGVESSTEEPAIEDLPEPPALSVEDTVKEMEEHHSITVTVTLMGIGQQVKQLLDEAVSSQS